MNGLFTAQATQESDAVCQCPKPALEVCRAHELYLERVWFAVLFLDQNSPEANCGLVETTQCTAEPTIFNQAARSDVCSRRSASQCSQPRFGPAGTLSQGRPAIPHASEGLCSFTALQCQMLS